MLRHVLLAAVLPQAAAALPWDGTYRASADADCAEEGGSLRIGEGVLHGIDSTCRMTDPVDVLDLDATLYVMQCEGEGQTWDERAMLMKAAEGDAIFLAWRGYVFRYDRCPEPEGASAEETPAGEEAPETEGEDASGNGEEAEPASDEAGDEAQEEPASEGEEDPAEAAPSEDE